MSVTAEVKVTLLIEAKSNWNDDVMVSQVSKQAADDAIAQLNRLAKDESNSIKIQGKPKVTIIYFDAE